MPNAMEKNTMPIRLGEGYFTWPAYSVMTIPSLIITIDSGDTLNGFIVSALRKFDIFSGDFLIQFVDTFKNL